MSKSSIDPVGQESFVVPNDQVNRDAASVVPEVKITINKIPQEELDRRVRQVIKDEINKCLLFLGYIS